MRVRAVVAAALFVAVLAPCVQLDRGRGAAVADTVPDPAPPPEAVFVPPVDEVPLFVAHLQQLDDRFEASPLRRIAGCESGLEHRPWSTPRWWKDTDLGSTASGGLQMLDSTYRSWVREFMPDLAGMWARAMEAPWWVQEELGLRAFDEYGTQPWRPSIGCWR